MTVRTRFAPSPTGFMHIGNLRTALYAFLYAKRHKGKFLLRIEDTDQERFIPGATELIYSTLKASSIIHDEGPDIGGDFGPYIQSHRKDIYTKYAERLIELGGAYRCFCVKDRLDSLADQKGVKKYDKHCLKLSKEEIANNIKKGIPYVVRQNVPTEGMTVYTDMVFGEIQVPCQDLEDGILLKSDGMPTYNFANVIDDHLMQITHVMRGTEYLSSTPKYNLIYDAFGWQRPKYMHLPPIMKNATSKLSKRYGDANFSDFIEKGFLPQAIINYIALLGWSPKGNQEKLTLEELIELFDVDGISKSSSIFDEAKMRWLNSLYIKELDFDTFSALAKPFYDKSIIANRYDYDKFSLLLQSRIETFGDIIQMVKFIDDFGEYDLSLFEHKKLKTNKEVAILAITKAIKVFENLDNLEYANHKLEEVCQEIGLKKGQMLFCLRVAVSGQKMTPGGAIEIADILGKQETLKRLHFSLELLTK